MWLHRLGRTPFFKTTYWENSRQLDRTTGSCPGREKGETNNIGLFFDAKKRPGSADPGLKFKYRESQLAPAFLTSAAAPAGLVEGVLSALAAAPPLEPGALPVPAVAAFAFPESGA